MPAFPWQINVDITINDGTGYNRFGLSEHSQIEHLSFEGLSKILKAFHLITEAIKDGDAITVNGNTIR